ncbi:MAG TPA: 3-hydroxyacyl-CoA dehydrogenase/enoyl-CoA hydratase family protein [Candidatus Hydrogenedentes bacterium]|nr:3-hydroxyacyl-CoA dehydrogenase/enoyl-CoA hydratase family protein [Candidatus Hydrogenedentota bacterium]
MIASIRRAAVLGSGVMGSAIAAHLANAGIPTLMLDIVPPGLDGADAKNRAKRNSIAETNRKALLKTKPSPLYLKDDIERIETGNFEDDLPRIAECDWIIEVVKEDLAIKRRLFAQVARHRRPGTILTTNTSGIQIREMLEPMDPDMRAHFLGAHFFNPPRYLKLLEIIPTPDTSPEVVAFMARFAEDALGKGVVYAKDTPNFIANRILTFLSQYLLAEFPKRGLTVEDVDALTGPIIGHAPSATLRTMDLVGLDTYVHVIGNVHDNCPSDEARDLMTPAPWLKAMIEKGLLGAKSGAGFYKKTDKRDENGRPVILTIDINTLDHVPQKKPAFACLDAAKAGSSLSDRIKTMHVGDDPGAQFVWSVFANTAIYAGNRIPEMADDIVNIDNAVKWGFAWEIGIFETWDLLGVPYVCDRMKQEGLSLPPIAEALLAKGYASFYKTLNGAICHFDLASGEYKPIASNPNAIVLANLKQSRGTVAKTDSCSLVDLGDGVLCAEFHSKMNTIDGNLVAMLQEGVRLLNEGQFEGMVVGNQGDHFSAGANLKLVLGEIMHRRWDALEKIIRSFQDVNMAMRFCKRPIVGAPHHYTFGGGIEMCQHMSRIVAAGETYGGLVEFGVGIIPAGGGSKEMLRRALAYVPANVPEGDPFPYVRRAFETIALAKVSTSGPELIELGYFSDQDIVSINGDHQIKRAKDVCLGLVKMGYAPPRPAKLTALGDAAHATFCVGVYQMTQGGYASDHDALIAEKLARVLTGGDRISGSAMSEQDILDLECEAMLSLCGAEKTVARLRHMLETGKPLRN